MNYEKLGLTVRDDLQAAVAAINNPEIEPEIRQRNLEILFKQAGSEIYNVVYSMNAWDMEVDYTTGRGIDDAYYGLAKVVSDSISVGGKSDAIAAVDDWLTNQVIFKAQEDAFQTAFDSEKHPIVERIAAPNCCTWCSLHAGIFSDPEPEVFRRHERCRCTIKTSGYRTRNGVYSGKGKGWEYKG